MVHLAAYQRSPTVPATRVHPTVLQTVVTLGESGTGYCWCHKERPLSIERMPLPATMAMPKNAAKLKTPRTKPTESTPYAVHEGDSIDGPQHAGQYDQDRSTTDLSASAGGSTGRSAGWRIQQ
jgi:hypothetical protein